VEHWGPWMGYVVKREGDPEGDPGAVPPDDHILGRVKVCIPGQYDETAWAYPLGFGGAPQWGINAVPPIGADVVAWFVNGREDTPFYMPAHHGAGETFPEFTHPDIVVAGTERVRLIIDPRDGYVALRITDPDAPGDDPAAELLLTEDRGARLFAKAATVVQSRGQLNVQASGDVEVQGRKVLRAGGGRPIS